MDHLSIDLETFSSVPIQKAGAQKYNASPDFEILLFAYSFNGSEPVNCDFAQGETLPRWVAEALLDPLCLKHAYNASFEWGCLSRYGYFWDWRHCCSGWSDGREKPMLRRASALRNGWSAARLCCGRYALC